MKLGRTGQYALGALWTLGAVTLGSRVAVANTGIPSPPQPQTIENATPEAPTAESNAAPPAPNLESSVAAGTEEPLTEAVAERAGIKTPELVQETFVSDGSEIVFEHLNMSIVGIEGWEAVKNGPNLSLILQDPTQEKTKVGKDDFKFQRNLTVVTRHQSRPVDKATVEELATELRKSVEKDTLVTQFQILESRFFDYRGKNDGLMIYSTMNIGPVPMLQMHVLISGEANHFLMTYTDIADRFNADRTTFEKVWNSMMSISVKGKAPDRYLDMIIYGASAFAIILLITVFSVLRRRRSARAYASLADSVYEDDQSFGSSASMEPVSMVWNLEDSGDDQGELRPPSGVVTGALSHEKTKQAVSDHAISSVSNFF